MEIRGDHEIERQIAAG